MNEAARPSGTVWFPNYIGTFSEARREWGWALPAMDDYRFIIH